MAVQLRSLAVLVLRVCVVFSCLDVFVLFGVDSNGVISAFDIHHET